MRRANPWWNIAMSGESRARSSLLTASAAFLEGIGLSPEDTYAGRTPGDLAGSGQTDPVVTDEMNRSLEQTGRWSGELLNRRADGSLWWADWEIGAVRLQGHLLGYIGAVRDVTPHRRADARRLALILASLCESHEAGLDGHLQRTSAYAALLARHWHRRFGRAGLDTDPEDLAVAALLHDIGKIGVPRGILTKAGPLTPEERATVEEHPRLGGALLRAATASEPPAPSSDYVHRLLALAAEVVLPHHERWDGSGYPDGLAGRNIPPSARLVAVVDVYDALRQARPYKAAWSEDSARAYLREQAGTHLDPMAVTVFLEAIGASEPIREAEALARAGL